MASRRPRVGATATETDKSLALADLEKQPLVITDKSKALASAALVNYKGKEDVDPDLIPYVEKILEGAFAMPDNIRRQISDDIYVNEGERLVTSTLCCSSPEAITRSKRAQLVLVGLMSIAMLAVFATSVHWSSTTDRAARDYYKIMATNALLPILHVNDTFVTVNTGVTTEDGLHIYSQRLPDLDFPQFMTWTLFSIMILYIGAAIASASWAVMRKEKENMATNGNIGIIGIGPRFFVDPILVFIACVILRQPYLTTRMDLVVLAVSAWAWSIWTERDYYEYFYPSDTRFKSLDPAEKNKQAIAIGQVRSFLAAAVGIGFRAPIVARLWALSTEINDQYLYVHLTAGEMTIIGFILSYFMASALLSLIHAFPTAWICGLNSKHKAGKPYYIDIFDAHVYTIFHLLLTTLTVIAVYMTWVIDYPEKFSWKNT